MGLFDGIDSMMMDPMAWTAMSAMQRSLPRIDPTRYAEGYEIRRSLRGAFTGPGTHPTGVRHSGMGGALAQMFGGGGYPSVEMPYSQAAAEALAPYGLSQTPPNPFLFFNDQDTNGQPTWAANHPRVARAIEGAMLGGANTAQGATTGENISNVLRSVMSIPGAYRASYNAQMQAPFDMARQIGALQDDEVKRQLSAAQAFHLMATGRQAANPAPKFQPFIGPNNEVMGFNPYDNTYTQSKNLTAGAPMQGPIVKPGTPGKPSNTAYPSGVKTAGERAAFNELTQAGVADPLKDPRWNDRVTHWTGRLAGTSAGAGQNARNVANAPVRQENRTLDDLKFQRDKAFQEYEAAKNGKLKPSDLRNRPEPTFTERAAGELRDRQAARDQAETAYQNAINSSGGNNPGAITRTTGTVGKPGGHVEVLGGDNDPMNIRPR